MKGSLKGVIRQITDACPSGEALSSCPWAFVREMDDRTRENWWSNMSLEECFDGLLRHQRCLYRRAVLEETGGECGNLPPLR